MPNGFTWYKLTCDWSTGGMPVDFPSDEKLIEAAQQLGFGLKVVGRGHDYLTLEMLHSVKPSLKMSFRGMVLDIMRAK